VAAGSDPSRRQAIDDWLPTRPLAWPITLVAVVTLSSARYDGHADWYDETFSPYVAVEDGNVVTELIGRADGSVCLDVACGTGRFTETLAAAGYRPIGIDLAADQLRIAQNRSSSLVRGDVERLPIRERSGSVAVGLYFHTDVEDFTRVLVDIARCLVSGGRFVYLGVHPCFVGAFVDRECEHDHNRLEFVPGYGESGWSPRGRVRRERPQATGWLPPQDARRVHVRIHHRRP
jgi:SAM-dependent methyltransferase